MSAISQVLYDILHARFGKDVRQAIHDGIELGYDIASDAQATAETAQDSASASATAAANSASAAQTAANNASISAGLAEQYKDEAFDTTPAGYEDFVSEVNSSLDYCIENGVKNLLEITATSDNFASIVATVLGDTVVINGTSTSSDAITVGTLQFDNATKVKLSGCPSGGGENTYYITIKNFLNGTIYIRDNGSGAEGTIPANTKCRVQVGFKSGVTFNDTLFKPMVTLARVTDSDYANFEPFAKPNYLLTPKTILSEAYTQNTANTLEDTGLSFTLEKSAFVALRTSWSHGKPLEIAVSKDFSSNNAQQFHFDYTEENSSAIFTTPVWLLPQGTYHISAKRNGTGIDKIAVVVLMELDIRGFTS